MPTIKKTTKAIVKQKSEKDLQVILNALKNGAKVVKKEYWNKTEYGIEYPTGGYIKITKTTYDKLSK